IAEALITAGKSAETPACVISRATTSQQRTVQGPLAKLPALVRTAELHAPSLIVVGECVRQRESIAWFERKPLLGKRVGITRPESQVEDAIQRLIALGAEPVLMPLVEICPPEDWSAVDSVLD